MPVSNIDTNLEFLHIIKHYFGLFWKKLKALCNSVHECLLRNFYFQSLFYPLKGQGNEIINA